MAVQHAKFRLGNMYLKIAVSLSVLFFGISLTQTAFYTSSPGDDKFSSAFAFALGWIAFLGGNFAEVLIWLANPMYILALILIGYRKKSSAFAAGITSLMLALCFINQDTIATSESGSGPYYTITIGLGYWLWLLAILILTIGIAVSNYIEKHRDEQDFDE